jgi:preprotein translocase subunit YajC
MTMLASIWTSALHLVLAQGGDTPPAGSPGGGGTMLIGLVLAMVVFWLITLRGNQREKKKRQQMLDNMAKNDRVQTIGGIVGTVVAIKGNEVIVKVDETNNTKITFVRSAIQSVLTEQEDRTADKK